MDPLACITSFVFYESGLTQSDVILVPGASRPELMGRAAELYHRGLAPLILPSGGPNLRIPQFASEWAYLRDAGLGLGVPGSAFLREDRAANTFENARFSLSVLQDGGVKVNKAILVCKTFHAMRAYLTCASAFPPAVGFCVSPVVDDRDIRRDNWYLDAERTRVVLGEVEKIGRYFPSEVPRLAARASVEAHPTSQRAAVIVVKDGMVALIRRDRTTGKVYYLFPGGHVERGESLEQAAMREALEELGIVVRLGNLVAVVAHGESEQYCYLAEQVAGSFGMGEGAEMGSPRQSEGGSHTPVWMDVSGLEEHDVRPRGLAKALSRGLSEAVLPLRIRD